ncbi:MAG: Bug family tripartite tricarboxylate transporter substrate binding protein [Burkholderiaceae bacterium]
MKTNSFSTSAFPASTFPVANPSRRTLIKAASALGAVVAAFPAAAQSFPSRPIRIVVGFAPGGATDAFARILAEKMQENLKQAVIVDNKAGAGGNIGAEYVARSAADGYTLQLAHEGMLLVPWLFKTPPFDPMKDFIPIGIGVYMPQLVVVSNRLPVKTIPELIAYAKANPGKLSYGSPGVGTGHHLNMEAFLSATGTRMVHVPYKGAAPMLTDIASGNVDVGLSALSSTLLYIQGNKLRVLAVASRERVPQLKDVPTVAETVPGFAANVWFGLMAPAGTPQDVTNRLAEELKLAVSAPDARERLIGLGYVVRPTQSAAEMSRFLNDELGRWGTLVKEASIEAR